MDLLRPTRNIKDWRKAWHLCISAVLFILSLNGTGSTASLRQTPITGEQPPPPGPILLTDRVADPKQSGVLFFPATGHTLRGVFRDYWQKYGGLAQFGYPLTEEFFEGQDPNSPALQVQYFERNRFELHPENKGTPYEVLLGVLGRDFHTQDAPVAPLPSPALYFPETGHNLSGKFREYWEAHGGLFVHGYPISEMQMETNYTDGKEYMVQWFERSRFELHPENVGSLYEVLLGLLGAQLVQKAGYAGGAYPRYGHAADFSWVAGKITLYAPLWWARPEAGCALLQHGNSSQRVQLNRAKGGDYIAALWQQRSNVVAIGRLRQTNEPITECSYDLEAPVFYVQQPLQFNR